MAWTDHCKIAFNTTVEDMVHNGKRNLERTVKRQRCPL